MNIYIYIIEILAQGFKNNSMPSKVFETTAMKVIQFHDIQVATMVTNTLTKLEFDMLFYKDLKMFYWVSATEF